MQFFFNYQYESMFENSNPLVDIVLVVQRTLLKMILYFKEYFL